MKKISILLFLMVVFQLNLLNAQTTKGKVFMGLSSTLSLAATGSDLMSMGFSTTKEKSDASGYTEPEPDKTTSLNLIPKVGYFVADNFLLGLDMTMAFANSKSGTSDSKDKTTLFSAGPFVRYYIPVKKVLPFFELNSAFGSVKYKYEYSGGSSDSKSSVVSLGGGVGMAVPIGDKVTFDIMAGYNSLTLKDKQDNPDNDRTVIGTFGLRLGFAILLGSSKE